MKIISLDETDNIIIQIGNRKFEAMLSMALYFSDHVGWKNYFSQVYRLKYDSREEPQSLFTKISR